MTVNPKNVRAIVAVGINVPVGLLHLVTGPHYSGPFPDFVNGYLIDIMLPFAFYFLLCLYEHPLMQPWYVKSVLVFAVGFTVETAQYLGYDLFGSTFDPLDYLAYTAGVLLAAAFESLVLARRFHSWHFPQ